MKFLIELIVALLDWAMSWKGKKRGKNGQNILLVENEPHDAALAINCLRDNGYETVHVTDKKSAMDSMRRLKHRCVIIDVGLGRENGWDLAEEIRLAGFSPTVTTIIMISGSNESFEAKPEGQAFMTIEKSNRWEALVDAVKQAGL